MSHNELMDNQKNWLSLSSQIKLDELKLDKKNRLKLNFEPTKLGELDSNSNSSILLFELDLLNLLLFCRV